MIALVTNHWSENEESQSMGLFQTCRKDGVICCTNNLDLDHREIFKKNSEHCQFVYLNWVTIFAVKATTVNGESKTIDQGDNVQ